MDTSLPYDRTPSPPESPSQPPQDSKITRIDPLDQPLDSYTQPIPSHVQSLLGRMGQGKVYLLEESPAILMTNSEGRIKNSRVTKLAEQLGSGDPTEWLNAISTSSPSPIRTNALYVRSDLIQHLSTSKVFSWTTGLGAEVMGIEWLNDTTLLLIFSTPHLALLALSLLSKAGFDPTEGDDPVLERAGHSVPISLLPTRPVASSAGMELLGNGNSSESNGNGNGVVRKGRGVFTNIHERGSSGTFDLDPLSTGTSNALDGIELVEGVDPLARIGVRFALESDTAMRKMANESKWYDKNGRGAGKERANGTRRVGGVEEEQVSWGGRGGEDGDGEGELKGRIGRERRKPYDRTREDRGGGRGGGRKGVEELDRELERFGRRRDGNAHAAEEGIDGDVDMDGGERSRYMEKRAEGERRGKGRGRRTQEDLDRELEEMLAGRGEG